MKNIHRLILIILIFFLLIPSLGLGAVGFDTASTATANSVTSLTISSYVVTGSNTLMLCSSMNQSQPISAVTFNGISFELMDEVNPAGTLQISLWKLAGVSGTHDIVFSYSGSAGLIVVGCATFTGVDQTTPTGSTVSTTNFVDAPISLTVPTDGIGYDVVGVSAGTGCDTGTPGGSQTKRFNDCLDFGSPNVTSQFSSTISASGTFVWTNDTGGYAPAIGVPINAASATSGMASRRRNQ